MDLSNFGVEVKENINKSFEVQDKNLTLNFEKIKKDFSIKEKERFLPWFLKYQLTNFDQLIITKEIQKIIDFIEKKPKNKGLLLVGRAGSGKTTTLNLIGEKYNFEIFELNASDARNKKSINESIGDVLKQRSLFNQDKLILIDEVDGVSGNNDRGGVAELVKYVKSSNIYLVFTANDKDSSKIKALKKVCITIDFENHSSELLYKISKRIFKLENIKYKEEDLKYFIEKRSTIDIRGFINDLQASTLTNQFFPSESLELRNYKRKIDSVLEKIFYSYPEDALKSSFNSDINLDDLFLYLEENVPNVYNNKSLILAFNEISKADIFRGRIMKWQYWRYLVYINFYLTHAVSSVKNEDLKHISIFKRNDRILKKWIYANKYNAFRPRTKIEKSKNELPRFIEKLAKYYSISAKNCRSKDLFYFSFQYKNNSNFASKMNKLLEIDEATKKALLEL